MKILFFIIPFLLSGCGFSKILENVGIGSVTYALGGSPLGAVGAVGANALAETFKNDKDNIKEVDNIPQMLTFLGVDLIYYSFLFLVLIFVTQLIQRHFLKNENRQIIDQFKKGIK